MSRSYAPITALFLALASIGATFGPSKEVSSKDSLESESIEIKRILNKVKAQKRPIKIAIVDTGLDRNDPRFSNILCKMGHRNFTNGSTNTYDTHGHGTHITGLIKQHAGESGYCLVILKYFDQSANGDQNLLNSVRAFEWASQIGVDIVNFSAGGSMYSNIEHSAIASARQTIFVVAAGNESQNISNVKNMYYPASYQLSNIFVVGNMSQNGARSPSSNYGDSRIIWEVGENLKSAIPCNNSEKQATYGCEGEMTGTSQATAVHTGKMIKSILETQ